MAAGGPVANARLSTWAAFFAWAGLFALIYTQAPLYYSNQNQYFLHGLAHAGLGFLDNDWLAGTRDPTPLFSALAAATFRCGPDWLYHGYFAILLGVYLYALAGVFKFLAGPRRDGALLVFLTALAAIHSGAARWASVQLTGVDYPWYFQAGVAGQYILGFGLQPSVFGVLLVLSVCLFIHERLMAAAATAALAGVVHATYLLPAALLVLTYMFIVWRQRASWRRAVLLGAWALLLVLPVVSYHLIVFAPSSREQFAEAQRLLVHFRIPHHAVPEMWFDGIAVAQLLWIVLAIWLVRGTVLCAVLLMPFFLSLILSIVQVATASDSLALLFPWRISAVLVPLATAIVLGKVLLRVMPGLPRNEMGGAVCWACIVVLALLAGGGLAISYLGLAYRSNADELPLLDYVRSHAERGDVYLLPVDVPRLETAKRGARSTSFTPPPLRGPQQHLIAIDLQRFRLHTGAPIVVDFKSIPYQDAEVLAWQDRLQTCRKLYREANWGDPAVRLTLARFGVTHVVLPGRHVIRDKQFRLVFTDPKGAYRLYQLR